MKEYVTVWKNHKPTKLHWDVPVVRCKDCLKSKPSECWEGLYDCRFIQVSIPPDGFCAWGERREA